MKIIIIFLLIGVLNAKEITIPITDGVKYTYKDVNSDGVFDTILIDKSGVLTVKPLKKVESRPSKEVYNNSELVLHTKSFSDKWQDAVFRIWLIKDSVIIGYYDHFYKEDELIYKEQE